MFTTPKDCCPFDKKACVETKCRAWVKLKGETPQGGTVDEWNCALSWLPILLVEVSQKTRQTGAEVHLVANEVSKAGRVLNKALTLNNLAQLTTNPDPKPAGKA